MRLELLAAELAPLFAEVPADDRPVRFHHLVRPAAAPLDRCGQPCRDGARPPHLSLRQGHARRPRRARGGYGDQSRSPTRSRATSPSGMIERERLMEGDVEPARPVERRGADRDRATSRPSAARRLAGLPVGARPGGGRRAGRPHRWSVAGAAVGPADRELRRASAASASIERSLPRLAAARLAHRPVRPIRRQFADRQGRAGQAAPHQPQAQASGSPEISSRFHCAAGCEPPIAWPPAATPTTGTVACSCPPIQ